MKKFKTAKIYGKFYSPEVLLSYNRPFMMSVGSRSIGKSTGWQIALLKSYLKTGTLFIYLRRTDKELYATAPTYFDDGVSILKEQEHSIFDFKYEHQLYWIQRSEGDDWEVCGVAVPLNLQHQIKSSKTTYLHRVGWILYDEFILEDSRLYLGSRDSLTSEYDKLMSLYKTVDRGIGRAFRNETRVICLGNNYSYFNPIYIGLGVDEYIRTDSSYIAPSGKLWVLEQTSEVEATRDIKSSWAYQLSGESQGASDYDNTAREAHGCFVERMTGPKQFMFNVKFSGHVMGIYRMQGEGLLYICDRPGTGRTISLTAGDQNKIDYMLAVSSSQNEWMKIIRAYYMNGKIRFQTNKCKYDIVNYFKLTP